MTFNEWNGSFSVEISIIDKQHYKIIELINEIIESSRDSREELVIKDVLNDLREYSNYHFGFEELLFKKYNYEKSKEHIKEHKKFIDKIVKLSIEATENSRETAFETLIFLRSWLQTHILNSDKEYVDYFRMKNVIKDIREPDNMNDRRYSKY
jgi:hemerythrin-like metal-binding protein